MHYYAAGYYYAAKNKGMTLAANDQASGSFASTPAGNVKFSSEQALRGALAHSESVSSSSSLYSGRLDYH